MANVFDYIVVGAGSAGSIVAARLAESGYTVALLEAGTHMPFLRQMPDPDRRGLHGRGGLWFKARSACQGRDAELKGRLWQARVVGGGASVNGQTYMRAAIGDFPWDAASVASAYELLEASIPRVLASPTLEEFGVPLRALISSFEAEVQNLKWRLDPHADGPTARISGAWRSQKPWSEIPNQDLRVAHANVARFAQEVGKSPRMSPFEALIGLQQSEHLELHTNSTAAHLLRDGIQVVGVELTSDLRFWARREVILSAGALQTPMLLLSSGLAPKSMAADGAVQLQDHRQVSMHVLFLGLSCEHHGRDDTQEFHALLNASTGTSHSHVDPVEFQVFVSEECCNDKPSEDDDYSDALRSWYCLRFDVILLHPSSVGQLWTETTSRSLAFCLPLTDHDVHRFQAVSQLLARVVWRFEKRLKEHYGLAIERELDPLMVSEGSEFETELRARLVNFNHPTGTCPIGVAVDHRLRVYGVHGVRLADASVLPASASGGTDAAAQLVGYMASEFILADAALDDDHVRARNRARSAPVSKANP